jgi:hypothetical protein
MGLVDKIFVELRACKPKNSWNRSEDCDKL